MVDSFQQYIQNEKRLSTHTVQAYSSDLDQFSTFVNSTYPDSTLLTVDYGIVRSWIVELVEKGTQASSVNRKIACLRSFYKFLMRQQVIDKNPLLKINVLKTKKQLPGFVKETDIVNLLDNQSFDDTFRGLRDQLVLELFYGTGIRLSELITLKESNIDRGNRTIKVLGKRNKERVIPFAQSIVSLLENYQLKRGKEIERKEHGFLLVTEKGEQLYPMLVYKIVKRYLSEFTSSEKRSPHILRHTYATHLLNNGAEINAVKDLLGHTSLAATQVYTHNSMDKLKKVFDQAHPKA